MVKQLKYLLFIIPFLFITNVNAWTLSQPYVNYEFANDSNFPRGDYATEQTHYNTTFYISPFLLGGVDYSDYVKSVYFSWYNSGFCSGQDISITGTLYGGGYGTTNGLFKDESVSTVVKNNGTALSCVFNNAGGQLMNFQCYGKGGGDFNVEFHLNSYHSPSQYNVGVSKEVSISCDASNLDVISNATANTNAIINNQNQNTQDIINNNSTNTHDIINNQNQNKQDVIDNQNQNTEKQIESQKVCLYIDKNSIKNDNYAIGPNGNFVSDNSYGVTDYIRLNTASSLKRVVTSEPNSNSRYCFYNINKEIINCHSNLNQSVGEINIPNNTSYVRFTILKISNRPQFEICNNGNQALNDSVNGLNDTLNSEDSPNTNQDIQDMDDMVASDTPISDLITMPLTLINAYINGMNATCSPVNLGNLYGTNLVLPCINLEQHIGSNLWHIIDALFSIFLCYNIGMLFISAFDGITSLRDDFEGLYQPRHADVGYQPKHGGGN